MIQEPPIKSDLDGSTSPRALNKAIEKYVDEHGGISNISKIRKIGASELHHSKTIGLNKETDGTLVHNVSKRLKKKGYVCAIFYVIKELYRDKKLHDQLDNHNYAIVIKSNLVKRCGKKISSYFHWKR